MRMNTTCNSAEEAVAKRKESIAWRIIQRFARGNVRMQKAAILSRKRLDEKAEARAQSIARLREIYRV